MLKRCLPLFLFFFTAAFVPFFSSAQESSNKGTDFWLGFTGHFDTNNAIMDLYITSDVSTAGTVYVPLAGWSVTFTVTANATTVVNIPNATAYVGCSDCYANKGIHVVSALPVIVYSHIYFSTHSDATLVLPVPALGKEYYAMAFTQMSAGMNRYSEFIVVATEDNTSVEITPTQNTLGGLPANIPFTISLSAGQVFQVQSVADLSGSHIISLSSGSAPCKRIAVFSGSTYDALGCAGASSGDNLYQQLFPINAWGTNFITAPYKTRVNGDVFRVLAGTNGTVVTFNGGSTFNLNAGQFHDTISSVPNFFTANHPITLAQYQRTQNCDGVLGDPSMTILIPMEQTLDTIALYSPPGTGISGQYINVIMKTTDTSLFKLDGSHVPFSIVPANSIYSYSRNTVANGNHTLFADSGFNAIAYGFGSFESYGYNAGANVKSLDQYFSASSNGIGNVSTTCVGSLVNFVPTTSYTPVSWYWYFGDGDTSTNSLPSHVYNTAGNFMVSLVTVRALANGCAFEDSSSYLLHIIPFPVSDFSYTNTCVYDSVHFHDLSIVTGSNVASWKYLFGDGDSSSLQNPTHHYPGTGTYNASLVVRSVAGCIDTTFHSIVIHGLPPANAGSDVSICTGFSTTLNATGGTQYQWIPTTGLSSGIIANPVSGVTTTTTYVVFVTDGNSCSLADTVLVTVNPNPAANAGADVSICPGSNTTLNAAGGTSYLWSPAAHLSSSTIPNPVSDPVSTTLYSVTVTDNNSCYSSDTVRVSVFPLPVLSSIADTICFGNSTTLNASGGVSYLWSPSAGLSSVVINDPVASPASSTIYTVTVTDQFTCNNDLNVLVHVNSLPLVNAGSDVSFCFGDSSLLHASGAITYLWSPTTGLNFSNISSPVAHPGNSVTYIITGTDINTCQNKDTVLVTVFTLPPADAGSDATICLGDSVSLLATGGTAYQWSPLTGLSSATIAGPNASPSDTLVYSVLVMDGNLCSAADSVKVIVHPLPPADAGPDLWVCPGASIQLSATGGISYSWSPTASLDNPLAQNPNSLSAASTNFFVTVTDIFSCIKTDSVFLVVNPVVPVNAGPDTIICFNDSVMMGANPTAPPGSTYGWTPISGIYDSTLANPYATPVIQTTYIVYVTNDTCHGHDTVIVFVNPLPSPVFAGIDSTICFGMSLDIGSDSVPGNSYSWTSIPSGFSSNTAEPMIAPSDTTEYVLLQIIDATGCRARDTIRVSVNPLPLAEAGTDTSVCFGGYKFLGSDSVPGLNYLWTSDPPGFNSTEATPFIRPGYTELIHLAATNSITGCVQSDSLLFTVFQLPHLIVTGDTILCKGSMVFLTASGGASYFWMPAMGLSSTNTDTSSAMPELSSTYYITVTDNNECKNRDSVRLTVLPLPVVDAGPDQTICPGVPTELSGSGGLIYYWSPAADLSSNTGQTVSAFPQTNRTFSMEAIDAEGCRNKDSIRITVFDSPTAAFIADSSFGSKPMLVEFTNQSQNAGSYIWDFGDTNLDYSFNPKHIYNDTGSFTVTLVAVNSEGCTDTTILQYIHVDGNTMIVIPNVFSPNGDFSNDYFHIESKGFSVLNGQIFNRWGVLIAEVDFMSSGWDGKMTNGETVSDGTYFYTLEATSVEGNTYQLRGFVELVH